MTNDKMKKTAILTAVFAFFSITFMLVSFDNSSVVAADGVSDTREYNGREYDENEISLDISALDAADESTDSMAKEICIPLDKGMSIKSVSLENHYIDRKLRIYIDDISQGYTDSLKVSCTDNTAALASYVQRTDGDGICVTITTDEVYEYESKVADGKLLISVMNPHDVYDKIVVVDAAGGGNEAGNTSADGFTEKAVTLNIVNSLYQMMSSLDIKIYYSRMDDTSVSDEERTSLIDSIKPDMVIGICADGKGVSTYYNDSFYIRNFGNVELADRLERDTAYETGADALGLFSSDGKYQILENSKVPSAVLRVGDASNADDESNLSDSSYIKKIAKGIKNAIEYSYSEMEEKK